MKASSEVVDVLGDAIKDKFPQIPQQVDNTVTLQRGLLNPKTGVWERNAEVRELNGYDEERISSLESRKNITYVEYMTEILKMATVSIGELDFSDKLEQLPISDRNLLFLSIIKTTYGNEKTIDQICQECKQVNEVTIDLVEDFPLQVPEFDPTEGLQVTLKNKSVVTLRPPTAEDSIIVSKTGATPAVQSTLMLARCSTWEVGKEPEDKEKWAKSLGMADRQKLINALASIKMGPKMEGVDVDCVHCGTKMPVMIDLLFLLLN